MLKSLFDPDGDFAKAMGLLGDLIALNVLFLVTSIPIVTIGASSAALYSALWKLRRGEGHVFANFRRGWRENWRRGTACWLPLLPLLALAAVDLLLAGEAGSFLWKLLAVFGLQVIALVLTLVFPLIARYDNIWRNHLANALVLAVGHLPRVLLSWLPWALAVGLTIWLDGELTIRAFLPLWLLVGYSGLSYVSLGLLQPVFRQLEEAQELERAMEILKKDQDEVPGAGGAGSDDKESEENGPCNGTGKE